MSFRMHGHIDVHTGELQSHRRPLRSARPCQLAPGRGVCWGPATTTQPPPPHRGVRAPRATGGEPEALNGGGVGRQGEAGEDDEKDERARPH